LPNMEGLCLFWNIAGSVTRLCLEISAETKPEDATW